MWSEVQRQELHTARKTHPDPRVRHRSQALLLLTDERSISEVTRLFQTARHRVRDWRDRYLKEGIAGLADKKRIGRPPKLGTEALSLLEEALGQSPREYGFLSTTWTVIDLKELLMQRQRIKVCPETVHRAMLKLGYRYRRPRHDLTHRQDAEAVASAKDILEWLKKRAPQVMEGFDSSMLMNVKSMPTLTWQRFGRRRVNH
jgi:transposase